MFNGEFRLEIQDKYRYEDAVARWERDNINCR